MRKIIKYILIILWMGLIFCLSNEPGKESTNTSNKIVMNVASVVENITNYKFNDEQINNYFSYPIRKLAHLSVYFVLGILFYLLLNEYNLNNKQLIISILCCILYAILDEIHQLFVIGRSGEVLDVLIDSFGSLLGIFTLKLFRR